MKRVLLLLMVMLPSSDPSARAAEGAAAPKPAAVIDFEADVIEGERQNPNLFLQFGAQQTTLEGVILERKHFNDFHRVDMRWRPFDYVADEAKRKSGGAR